ncbi:helix-turn-helix domain-containing protein [Sorangium sp. So ce834]|uniref:transposase n=1 Tax=Sorangium sp. So ce834 TaxID=3133321 RepID=UPI003F62F26B
MDLHLFLAHADDHAPVLGEGLPRSAAEEASAAAVAPPRNKHKHLARPEGLSDSLPDQRWGIVAPKGPAGDRLLRCVAPLRKRREEEQGAEAVVYRVDPGMDLGAVTSWLQGEYWDAVGRRVEDLPGFVLVLGGPELVSWDLQQQLGADACVGRLAFEDDGGYEAYVDKVLRWERAPPIEGARALFHAVRDGSRATSLGYDHLMRPSIETARRHARRGLFPAAEIVEIGGDEPPGVGGDLMAHAAAALREAERSHAGVLFSLSHGAGAPRAGWRSLVDQHARQGAMVLGASGELLTASDVAGRPFLPGGAWLFFACFGAGTPAQSAYYPWLDRLHKLGWSSSAERVLTALPKGGEPPFAAALPQAALANPDGPLGVIGHVDLAWTWSFLDHGPGGVHAEGGGASARPERFQGVLRALANGHRLGVAHHQLARFFRTVSTELSTLYDEGARLGLAVDTDAEDEPRRARRAGLWMQRQDLCAYVLLGDPAARLPIARRPPGIAPSRDDASKVRIADVVGFLPDLAPGEPPAVARDPARRAEAVLEVLRRDEDARAIAARHGVTEAELRRWVDVFVEAGRAAVAKLDGSTTDR